MKLSRHPLRWVVSLAALAVSVSAVAQTPDLLTRIQNADRDSSIVQDGLLPWHLKMSVQLYDAKGKPSETGTIEQWWNAPGLERIDYTFPSYTAVIAHTKDGFFQTAGAGSPPYYIEYLRRQVVHPMPRPEDLADGIPDLRKQTFGKGDFDCIMIDQPIKSVPHPPLGLFPTYCLERGKDILRLSSDLGIQTAIRVKVGAFQAHTVALDLMVNSGQIHAASSHIEQLQGHATPYAEASVTDGLTPLQPFAMIAGGVMAGNIVSKIQPVYPTSARAAHISGAVVLRAVIGTDGHIHSLKIVSTPDPDLAIAAIAAVRQWVYKPYTLNGQPTEVDTTITVNFNFG